jgi:hypothetical protein
LPENVQEGERGVLGDREGAHEADEPLDRNSKTGEIREKAAGIYQITRYKREKDVVGSVDARL